MKRASDLAGCQTTAGWGLRLVPRKGGDAGVRAHARRGERARIGRATVRVAGRAPALGEQGL